MGDNRWIQIVVQRIRVDTLGPCSLDLLWLEVDECNEILLKPSDAAVSDGILEWFPMF